MMNFMYVSLSHDKTQRKPDLHCLTYPNWEESSSRLILNRFLLFLLSGAHRQMRKKCLIDYLCLKEAILLQSNSF
jgi:hypothetical protein